MVRCLSEVYAAIQQASKDSVLLATPQGTIVCVASNECAEQSLQYLPSGISVIGPIGEVEDDIDYVVESIPQIRIEGALEVLANKTSGSYHPTSVEKARQVLQEAILINGNTIQSMDKNLTPSDSTYQLALDLSSQNRQAPVILSEEGCYRTSVELDVIMLPDSDISAKAALLQQFDALVQDVKRKALHFQPPGFGVPLTFLDSHCKDKTRELHKIFSVPLVSYFHPVQAIRTETSDSEGRLITPHTSVAGVKSRDVITVSGDYAYHHYMQVIQRRVNPWHDAK